MQTVSESQPKGEGRAFPQTMWTVLLAARDPAAPEAVAAREEICRAYWRPVLSYLQSLGLRPDEAEDVTQTLLAHFCRPGGMAEVDREKGRLRHFLKASARHALWNFRRDARALKRGGATTDLPLDTMTDAELPADSAPSDAVFDQQWAWTIFDRAMRALEENYALRGKGALLEALKPALISADEVQPCAVIGSQFGVKEPQIVRVSLVTRGGDARAPHASSARVTAQRIVYKDERRAKIVSVESLDDPVFYQEFFSRLSKSVFLEEQKT